jgi:hypothetical protein
MDIRARLSLMSQLFLLACVLLGSRFSGVPAMAEAPRLLNPSEVTGTVLEVTPQQLDANPELPTPNADRLVIVRLVRLRVIDCRTFKPVPEPDGTLRDKQTEIAPAHVRGDEMSFYVSPETPVKKGDRMRIRTPKVSSFVPVVQVLGKADSSGQ